MSAFPDRFEPGGLIFDPTHLYPFTSFYCLDLYYPVAKELSEEPTEQEHSQDSEVSLQSLCQQLHQAKTTDALYVVWKRFLKERKYFDFPADQSEIFISEYKRRFLHIVCVKLIAPKVFDGFEVMTDQLQEILTEFKWQGCIKSDDCESFLHIYADLVFNGIKKRILLETRARTLAGPDDLWDLQMYFVDLHENISAAFTTNKQLRMLYQKIFSVKLFEHLRRNKRKFANIHFDGMIIFFEGLVDFEILTQAQAATLSKGFSENT